MKKEKKDGFGRIIVLFLAIILVSVLGFIAINNNSETNSNPVAKKSEATRTPTKQIASTTSTPTVTATPIPTPRIKKVVRYKKGKMIAEHTIYHYSSYSRDMNLLLYCKAINRNKKWKSNVKGYFLKPGETFEWYDAIGGSPTAEQGYKSAPVIVNHQSVQGIGGGACEVASTINTTVLKIDGITTHAIAHSVSPGYFRRGVDFEASVAYGQKTFSFTNTKKYGLLIRMSVSGGNVTCKVFKMKRKVKYIEY